MAIIESRRHEAVLPWLRAVAFAGVTYAALAPLGFYPVAVPPIVALAAGVLGMLVPGAGVLVFVIATAIPLAAGNILVGALFLILGFSTIMYLGENQGAVFLSVALAFGAILIKAEWGAVVLIGYLLGPAEGAVAALVACLLIEVTGLLFGQGSVGSLAIGAVRPIVDPARLARLGTEGEALTFRWLMPAVSGVKPAALLDALTGMRHVILFAAQPFLWASAAALAGMIRRPPGDPKRPVIGLVAVAAGVGALAIASMAAMRLLGGPVAAADLATTAGASVVVALAVAALSDWVFAPKVVVVERIAIGAEDADVDDLLRMISSAEEELSSKHTVQRIVMITDMKGFSRLTQDLGSIMTAKLVQRHRDICIPVIEGHGGKGKSSGGDGLVAAFEDPAAAVAAAVEMQQALAEYNARGSSAEAVLIRIGIAKGEVVLDKGGKPFLGDALNLAARVMGLADGGQVFTTADIASSAGDLPSGTVSHGRFRLKNISEPADLVEILWRPGQEALRPTVVAEETETETGDVPDAGPAPGETATAAPQTPAGDTPRSG